MTRELYDKATVSLDRINKLEATKAKLKREFPEWEYDSEAKEIGERVFYLIDCMVKQEQTTFDHLK